MRFLSRLSLEPPRLFGRASFRLFAAAPSPTLFIRDGAVMVRANNAFRPPWPESSNLGNIRAAFAAKMKEEFESGLLPPRCYDLSLDLDPDNTAPLVTGDRVEFATTWLQVMREVPASDATKTAPAVRRHYLTVYATRLTAAHFNNYTRQLAQNAGRQWERVIHRGVAAAYQVARDAQTAESN